MATTNFFTQIASLDIVGNLCFTISKGGEDNLVVSVLLQNDGCADKAKNLIPPLIFRGIPQKIDEAFFEDIKAPIEKTSDLMDNMSRYLEQVEVARKASAMEKEKSDKGNAKEKKYREAMQKVDELDKEGKPRDAWMKVPNPADYPEHSEAIRKRKTELSAKFAPDLFAEPVDDGRQTQQEIPEDHSEEFISDEEEEDESLDEDNQMED
jgi:PRTRC genetic system protein E